jgi:hypothetical protein
VFIGHFAAGLAAVRLEPRLRLGDALLAAQLSDVIWPVLVLAGVERVTIAPGDTVVTPLRFDSYPYSHSLLMVAVWGVALGALHFLRHQRVRAAFLLAGLALSHWLLDVASHRPDMPLLPGDPTRLGLGLWNSRPATMIVEGAMFALGVASYARLANGSRRGFAILVLVLTAVYLANMFSPPPPSVAAVAWSALLLAPILWLCANRVDRRARPA